MSSGIISPFPEGVKLPASVLTEAREGRDVAALLQIRHRIPPTKAQAIAEHIKAWLRIPVAERIAARYVLMDGDLVGDLAEVRVISLNDLRLRIGGANVETWLKTNPPRGSLPVWTGFAVEPEPGNWERFDPWLMNLLAWKVQHPTERTPSVNIIGKTNLAHEFAKVFGRHAQVGKVGGAFNYRLRDCVWLVSDRPLPAPVLRFQYDEAPNMTTVVAVSDRELPGFDAVVELDGDVNVRAMLYDLLRMDAVPPVAVRGPEWDALRSWLDGAPVPSREWDRHGRRFVATGDVGCRKKDVRKMWERLGWPICMSSKRAVMGVYLPELREARADYERAVGRAEVWKDGVTTWTDEIRVFPVSG
ncbi:MAG: hypothetical protein KJ622_03700 [Alphaproteobacteria bacterium]|nr:hypothetical protein [Alphaproteobacteria bacterium]